MKYVLCGLAALSLAACASNSTRKVASENYLVDGMDPDSVVQSVKFTGQPGFEAEAGIVRNGEGEELSLVILHNRSGDVRKEMVLDNRNLGLTVDGMAGTESSLAVAPGGSLQIKQMNDSVGRYRWERTLTVSFRNGQYVISGFTYSDRDTLDPNTGGSCDYNLLTGRGKRNNKNVKVKANPPALKGAGEAEKFFSCKGW